MKGLEGSTQSGTNGRDAPIVRMGQTPPAYLRRGAAARPPPFLPGGGPPPGRPPRHETHSDGVDRVLADRLGVDHHRCGGAHFFFSVQRYAIRASMSPAGSVAKDLIGGLRVEPAFWAMALGLVSHCLRVSASCLLPIASRAPLGFPTPPTEWHILHFCSSK